jgi:hypothetical protein
VTQNRSLETPFGKEHGHCRWSRGRSLRLVFVHTGGVRKRTSSLYVLKVLVWTKDPFQLRGFEDP